jgi:CubicO group peptidase (beta-lactamase class C family)
MGSFTKSMTATVLGILLADNKIAGQNDINFGWNSTLESVFPTMAPGTQYEHVALAAMAAMRSGLGTVNFWTYTGSRQDFSTTETGLDSGSLQQPTHHIQ